MGFALKLLMLPVLGGPQMVHWLARTIAEETQRQVLDKGPVQAHLLELQELFDSGELGEEEYDRQERVLLECLNATSGEVRK